MKWESFGSYEELSGRAAAMLLGAIRENPRAVLGLPTGRTPVAMYQRVVAQCSREYHCFREVVTFNLDEYAGIAPDHPGSYWTFMTQQLFDHVDIDRANTHIPNGNAPDLDAECARYEREIAGAGDLALVARALGVEVGGVAVRDVRVRAVDVDVIEQLLRHERPIAARMVRCDPGVFIEVEGDHFAEAVILARALRDHALIHRHRRASGRQAENGARVFADRAEQHRRGAAAQLFIAAERLPLHGVTSRPRAKTCSTSKRGESTTTSAS